jgi:uncharacterized protein YfkK (UPF0435 family)
MLRTIYLLSAFTIFAPSIKASEHYYDTAEATSINQKMNMLTASTIKSGDFKPLDNNKVDQLYNLIINENGNAVSSLLRKLFFSQSLQALRIGINRDNFVASLMELYSVSNRLYEHTTTEEQKCYIAIWKINLNYELFERQLTIHIFWESLKGCCHYLGNFFTARSSVDFLKQPYCFLRRSVHKVLEMCASFKTSMSDEEHAAFNYLKTITSSPTFTY